MPAPPVEVPFELSGNYVFVEVRVNGREASFAFDTGAQGTAINSDLARRMGIKASFNATAVGADGPVQVSVAPGQWVELGSLSFGRVDLILVPLAHLEERLGRPIDGIVGSDLLDGRVVVVDQDRRVIEISDRRTFRSADWGEPCTLSGVPGHMTVRGAIQLLDGAWVEGPFVVDSGAGRFLTLATPFSQQYDLESRVGPTYLIPGGGAGIAGSRQRVGHVRGFRFCDLEVRGDKHLEESAGIPASLSQVTSGVLSRRSLAGLLGSGILNRFNIAYDASGRRMYLRRNARSGDPFRSDASGLVLLRRPGGEVRVVEIVPGSSADRAGIRPGDVLRSIDGAQTAPITLEAVRAALRVIGETRRLQLERDGAPIDFELLLRPLGRD